MTPEGEAELLEERFQHLKSLSLRSLQLELYASPELADDPYLGEVLFPALEKVWAAFLPVAKAERIPQGLGLSVDAARQTWEIDLNIVTDAAIREVNASYRNKDEATDVLSFTLLADSGNASVWASLPGVQLGSLFISLDWARNAVRESPAELPSYVSERFVHGLLHLMGVHHDTMAAYERVVAIQKRVIDAASGTGTEA